MSPTPRNVSESLVTMTELVLPEDTNPRGTIFGGRVLALIDKCAAVVAMRHARERVVTVAMDSVVFVNKVRLGDVLLLTGRLNAAFHTSMEIEVEVRAEDPTSGEQWLTTTAFVTMVAVCADGTKGNVPPLKLVSDEEKRRATAAVERRRDRLSRR